MAPDTCCEEGQGGGADRSCLASPNAGDYKPSMPAPKTPRLAADIIIELSDRPEHPIVLIERKSPPLGWALPGGFVDVGESVAHAAVREALEETALTVALIGLLGVYSDPGRDPRGHTASVVYLASAAGDPRAQDDAKTVRVVGLDDLPADLAFDHAQILADYRRYRERGERPPPDRELKSRRA
jgi:8-oxo-dGTP diphosphatase